METLKIKFDRASRYFKRQIARASRVTKIGEKLESYPLGSYLSGTHAFWALSKAALALHTTLGSLRFLHYAQVMTSWSIRLKSNKPDGISPLVLCSCAFELTPMLTRLFRHSYSVSVVPVERALLSTPFRRKAMVPIHLTTGLLLSPPCSRK